jgi:FkbM family methyltransferase
MLSNFLANLSTAPALRRVVLPLLKRFNPGDVCIRHHYTSRRLLLHSYRHRGYWFHGRRREQATMRFFQQVLRPGDTVIEVGGHIGYLTIWLAELVGTSGRVIVFEPGRNNLPYLCANVAGLTVVEIVEAAVSDRDGTASFFEEQLTGQNNSLLADYERFKVNREAAYSDERYNQRLVATVRLDSYIRERGLRPDLIKIDIEGAEFLALSGATGILAEHRPMLMVEVTRQAVNVFDLLTRAGYQLFTPEGTPLRDAQGLNENVCAIHPEKNGALIKQWISIPRRSAA